jgi:uncharacterized iron-regulated membrane protein
MPEPIGAYWEALPVWITFGLAVLAALLLLWIAIWGWVRWPKRKAARLTLESPKDRADVEDNFRKTAGQAIGGVVVLLGAGLAYLQFSEQQQSAWSCKFGQCRYRRCHPVECGPDARPSDLSEPA